LVEEKEWYNHSMSSKRRSYAVATVLLLLGLNFFIWPYVLKTQALTVTFFDVGQGDAIFIEIHKDIRFLLMEDQTRKC